MRILQIRPHRIRIHMLTYKLFTPCAIFHAFADACRLISKLTSPKTSFRDTIRVPNGLDPDSVGPDLGPNLFSKVIIR